MGEGGGEPSCRRSMQLLVHFPPLPARWCARASPTPSPPCLAHHPLPRLPGRSAAGRRCAAPAGEQPDYHVLSCTGIRHRQTMGGVPAGRARDGCAGLRAGKPGGGWMPHHWARTGAGGRKGSGGSGIQPASMPQPSHSSVCSNAPEATLSLPCRLPATAASWSCGGWR